MLSTWTGYRFNLEQNTAYNASAGQVVVGPRLPVTDIAQAKAFYSAALAPLGYSVCFEGNYGAFVIDPEGNNIEAVCHLPE